MADEEQHKITAAHKPPLQELQRIQDVNDGNGLLLVFRDVNGCQVCIEVQRIVAEELIESLKMKLQE